MTNPDQSELSPGLKEHREQITRSVIKILKEVAEKCKLLHDEATQALQQRDTETYKWKLIERGQLLLTLQSNLTRLLDGVSPEIRQRVLTDITRFAIKATGALKERNLFLLAMLLQPTDFESFQNRDQIKRNELEELIDFLEEKLK